MKNYVIQQLHSQNGIQRDGTRYDSKNYIDGQWCRFYEGDPRKMGGYEVIDIGNDEIARDLFSVPRDNSIDLYIGRASSLNVVNINVHGGAGTEVDRTPTIGFAPDPNNVWDFDLFTNTGGGDVSSSIVAQVAPSGSDISSTIEGNIYYGDVDSAAPLTLILDSDSAPVLCSGGIVFSSPVMVAYGNDGLMRWSEEGNITDWHALGGPDPKFLVIANTKLVKAYRTRGGGTPTLLIWSLNSLSRAVYTLVGTPPIATFVSDTVEDDITILSADSIVKYNQQFWWVGTDQFYFFNGIVQKLKNTMNNDWFFENINLEKREKVWGLAIPRFKEIWWFYVRLNVNGVARPEECNAAVIYNIEEDAWYDTLISRSAGVQASIYPYPLMADSELVETFTSQGPVFTYPIWTHEVGTDRKVNGNSFAIDSYFETHQLDLWSNDGTSSNLLRNRRVAPDFRQLGDMSVQINTQMYPNSPIVTYGPYPFSITTEKLDFASQGGLVSFLFRSNVAGGFYQGGKILYFYEKGDTLK